MPIVKYQGRDIEAIEVDVITSTEPWNEYRLPDGKVLCVKTVLMRAFKATHEKTPDGEPLYLTNTQNFVKVR